MFALIAAVAPEPSNGDWLPHDHNEVIWGTIAFVLVMAVLIWKAGPAIKAAAGARPERISGELNDAASARDAAERERDRIKSALADSDSEAARIVEDARQTADRLKADIAARASHDVVALRERAAGDLESARRQAEADLRADVSRLALGAAERVVHHNLDDTTHQSLIEAYIAQVGATN